MVISRKEAVVNPVNICQAILQAQDGPVEVHRESNDDSLLNWFLAGCRGVMFPV